MSHRVVQLHSSDRLSCTRCSALIGSMPPAAQGPVLASARPLLDDKAWAKLCRALEQAPAGGWTTP